ncbi:MAG: type VI secretion system protein TssA [Desulfobacteraceae bacterium]|jgi:type VI secretion system protein VasJ
MEKSYRILGVAPVSKDEPCGRDVRYDDVFSTLQQEMDKLSSPATRDTFSWAMVADQASLILRDHSKDLLAASYLAVALTHMNGAQGLETGSWILRDLLTTHWDNLFPSKKRLKGRAAAINWWMEKTEAAVEEGKIWGFDSENRDVVSVHLTAIDDFLQNHVEEITLMPLIRKVENLSPIDKPSISSKMEASSSSASRTKTTASNMGDMTCLTMTDSDDLMRNLNPLFQKLKQAAKWVNQDRLENPQAYRWLRFAIWEPLKTLPVSKDRITKIPPPSPQTIAQIESLYREEDWQGLLMASESALHSSRHLFYLDLNRYSHEALSNMGKKFENARDVVLFETRHFTARLGDVENLLFSDQSPFAGEQTKEWLKRWVHEGTGNGDFHSGVVGSEKTGAQEQIAELKEYLSKGGRLPDVVALFQKKINGSSTGKDALLFRLELVKLLALSKHEKIASSQIEHVLDALERHSLDIWEPELAFIALRTVYSIMKTYPETRCRVKPDDILVLLGKMDILEAMKL